ncbi:hypothetical protein BOC56_29395 [Burkholderia pseudomallei]|nr:hypothetical protein BOC56_29395 [Burkholderia pseudomallei]
MLNAKTGEFLLYLIVIQTESQTPAYSVTVKAKGNDGLDLEMQPIQGDSLRQMREREGGALQFGQQQVGLKFSKHHIECLPLF